MINQSLRTFIALEVDKDFKKDITLFSSYLSRRKISLSGLRITDINNIHLTLFFLGDFFDKESISNFSENFKKIRFSKIPFRFKEIGFFPDDLRPRVIWISPDDDASNKIIDIRNNIFKNLELYGFKDEEREFKPHITIARVKNFEIYRKYIDFIKTFYIDGNYCFESLVLFNSVLTPNGPIYKKVVEAEIQ